MQAAPHDDAAVTDRVLFANLGMKIPPRLLDGRCDELGADIPFAESLLGHSGFPAASYRLGNTFYVRLRETALKRIGHARLRSRIFIWSLLCAVREWVA